MSQLHPVHVSVVGSGQALGRALLELVECAGSPVWRTNRRAVNSYVDSEARFLELECLTGLGRDEVIARLDAELGADLEILAWVLRHGAGPEASGSRGGQFGTGHCHMGATDGLHLP